MLLDLSERDRDAAEVDIVNRNVLVQFPLRADITLEACRVESRWQWLFRASLRDLAPELHCIIFDLDDLLLTVCQQYFRTRPSRFPT